MSSGMYVLKHIPTELTIYTYTAHTTYIQYIIYSPFLISAAAYCVGSIHDRLLQYCGLDGPLSSFGSGGEEAAPSLEVGILVATFHSLIRHLSLKHVLDIIHTLAKPV